MKCKGNLTYIKGFKVKIPVYIFGDFMHKNIGKAYFQSGKQDIKKEEQKLTYGHNMIK